MKNKILAKSTPASQVKLTLFDPSDMERVRSEFTRLLILQKPVEEQRKSPLIDGQFLDLSIPI